MKKSAEMHKALTALAYIVMLTGMTLLLAVVFRYPQNHLIPRQMIPGVGICVIALLAAGALWNKIYSLIGKRTPLYLLALAIFGVLLYITSLSRQGNENTLVDYTYVYRDAMNLATGGTLEYTDYFVTYSNNLKPMLLLSVWFRVAVLLGISPFHFVLLRNVLLVLLVVWACGYLTEQKGDCRWRFPILLTFAFLLPLWDMVSVFYTDSMSFGLGILTLALLKKAGSAKINRGKTLWSVLAGAVTVLAIIWKITAIIPLIACTMILLWQREKSDRHVILSFVVSVIVFGVGLQLWANTYDVTRKAAVTANPVISWVALGMKEDGSWTNNTELVEQMYQFSTKEEKQQYCVEYIRENKADFFNAEHLRKKASYNFANGNLGASAFLNVEQNDQTLIWEMFSPWGSYYWRTSQYCFCYMVAMYVLLFLGMLFVLRDVVTDRKPSTLLMICHLGFFGIVVFLMLWEASGRQLYNQMPGILLGGVLSIDYFWKNLSIKPRK